MLPATGELIDSEEIRESDWRGLEASGVRINDTLFDRVCLSETRFPGLKVRDVRIEHCDAANAEWRGLIAVRLHWNEVRLAGFRAIESDCKELVIESSDCRFAQFRFARLKKAVFRQCNLAEADFYGADLEGVRFEGCDLRQTDMSNANLMGADVRGSNIEGLRANAPDVNGLIVDPAQAMQLAPLLGLKIL